MKPPARVYLPMKTPSYSGLYLTPCGCMVTGWASLPVSALRKCTTMVSPTSACSVGPGIAAGPSGAAEPSVICWYTVGVDVELPGPAAWYESSRLQATFVHLVGVAWIQNSTALPPGCGEGVT